MIFKPLLRAQWLLATLLLITSAVQAQTGFFTPLSSGQAQVATSATTGPAPIRSTYYSLKTADLGSYLRKAPLEFQSSAAPLQLSIPLPNGTQETFGVYESPILAPAIAAQNPTIKTYTGRSLANPTYTIRLSMTSSGFDAIILGVENDAVYYAKVSQDVADQRYVTYFAQDVKKAVEAQPFGLMGGRCGVESKPVDISQQPTGQARTATNTGNMLRTFRLAVAATGEFTQRKGGNVNSAFNALVAYVNRMNAVYRVELNVAFQLVSGVNLVYPDPNTDPYDNSKQAQMLDENQANLVSVLGVNAFDVGHVFGASRGSGGGIASSPSICNDAQKGRGVSGVGDGSFAAVFDDQLITHEVGHQFSMQHTFNSVIPVCTTRKPEASVEPGAGATIMSYGFTCSGDDYEKPAYEPFLNFHAYSINEANTQIGKVTCFSSTAINNAAPVIGQFPTNTTIPKSTPFELSGTATDANTGDVLSYSWESMNIGTEVPTATTLLDTSKPPFFRSYIPTATGYRAFPRLAAILDGTNTAIGDKLPSVGIATTNRLTVRDGAGGVIQQDVTVTIDGNSGPFLITSNLNGSYQGSTQQTVTWSVNNTDQAPVSCANVNILLSTDGGLTFPTTLLANTPNDGTESVTFPNVTANKCRLKVIASNNIFFDISNSNFTVLDPNNQPPVAVAIPNQTGTLDAAFAFTPPAFTDPENQALDYRAVGLPASLSMNATTRAITGTPAAVGPFSVTVIATDPGNLSASTTFTLTVSPTPFIQLVASGSVVSTTVLTTGAIVANASASGGRPPYQFNFDGVGGSYLRFTSTPQSLTITGMAAGVQTLSVIVTDNTLPINQTVTATITVTVVTPGTILPIQTVQDGLWSEPATWLNGRLPALSDVVLVNHAVTVPTGYTGQGLTIRYGSGARLIWQLGGRLQLGR
jgi:Metallo-peptidase family M12B Reprolysin-like/Putative Ig domain